MINIYAIVLLTVLAITGIVLALYVLVENKKKSIPKATLTKLIIVRHPMTDDDNSRENMAEILKCFNKIHNEYSNITFIVLREENRTIITFEVY